MQIEAGVGPSDEADPQGLKSKRFRTRTRS
jgi:hypothetical protein